MLDMGGGRVENTNIYVLSHPSTYSISCTNSCVVENNKFDILVVFQSLMNIHYFVASY